ncbi:hypothetical protein B0T14DRAFT_490477 [Immersiella caudata]|uniref:Uncharacterized protein n=1 Tax=Immersiella caudata TaxID=314043 RepID=A0AA40CAX7_9PEZI|nr:hypothetical protein B0T14DRAFT_490477 [Immersiella caudata]
MSESEAKEPEAEAGPPAKRVKIVVKKATETTLGHNASAIIKANTKTKLASPPKLAEPLMTRAIPSPATAKTTVPAMAAASPQGTKRKRDAPVALKRPTAFHETRVQEMLINPADFDDCVFAAPASARGKLRRSRQRFQRFRQSQGSLPPPNISGALPGLKGRAATEDDASGEERSRPKLTKAVKDAGDGGLVLGWVPGEPRWKRRSYFGPGRSRLGWN